MTVEIRLGEPTPPAQKVCIIGSSYIGALLQAYREFEHEQWHHRFSFFGAAINDFPGFAIRDGRITGFTHKSPDADEEVSRYDYFVVYGDMMIPHEIANFEMELKRNTAHSRALRRAMIGDWTRMRHSRTLAEQIAAATAAPVFLLPRNVTLEDTPKDFESYMFGVRLLREFVKPVVFLEMPYEIMGAGFITDPAYHKGSRVLEGTETDQADHDLAHMNLAGGKAVLKHIARSITRDYFSKAPG